jgi:hypothetical protein
MEKSEVNGGNVRQARYVRRSGSSCDSLELLRVALHHARQCLLARSGAGGFGRSSTSGGAASGRRTSGASPSQRGLRPHCGHGAAESGFIGRRRRPCRALHPPMDAGFTMKPLNDFRGSQLAAVIPAFKSFY